MECCNNVVAFHGLQNFTNLNIIPDKNDGNLIILQLIFYNLTAALFCQLFVSNVWNIKFCSFFKGVPINSNDKCLARRYSTDIVIW